MKRGSKEERTRWDETIMQAQEELTLENKDCKMLTRICSRLSLDAKYLNPKEEGHYNNAGMQFIGEESAKKALSFWR